MINGHPTWVVLPKKNGRALVLLHGGYSSSESLLHSIGPRLGKHYRVCAFDRIGHGRTADTSAPFSYESMGDEVISFLKYIGRPAHVVGHSDGANAALFASMKRPDLVIRQVLVGANYHANGLLPLEHMEEGSQGFHEWSEHFAERNPSGLAGALAVFRKTDQLQRTQPQLTTSDLQRITVPTLVMAGDDDVATLAHTASLYESIPQAQLCIIPGTSHGVLKEATKLSARIIRRFLEAELPVVTRMPLRRAATIEHLP